ncbi:MAG: AgmX/PglI C-terminal domain-containing protein [Polyangiales bacterium]
MAHGVPDGGGGNKVGVGIAIVLLLGGAVAVLYFATKKPVETTKTTTTVTSVTNTAPTSTLELPPLDLPTDAGEDTAVDAGKAPSGGFSNPCTATCDGTITPEIKAAASARANTAKQCYISGLQDNESLSGDMKLRLKIGSNGQFCGVSVISDSTGSPKLQACVKQRLSAVSYPVPKGGCLEVDVPIKFKNKGK